MYLRSGSGSALMASGVGCQVGAIFKVWLFGLGIDFVLTERGGAVWNGRTRVAR